MKHPPAGLISAKSRVWLRQARAVLAGGTGSAPRRAARSSPVISETSAPSSSAPSTSGNSRCALPPAGPRGE